MNDPAVAFRAAFDVSRETFCRLQTYEQLLRKWNKAINLIAPTTLEDVWHRHFHDSAAAFFAAKQNEGRWIDLGSGGGFPGAVAAILAAECAPDLTVTCIEADVRKATFLRTLAGATGVTFGVLSRRIEETPPQGAAIVSARALAPLTRLLEHLLRHGAPGGRGVFLKGESWRDEIDEALVSFRFSVENVPSPTNPGSAILVIGDVSRA